MPRDLGLKCGATNYFPVFYGGVYHNFPRFVDATPDEVSIVVCGESYSYNFVNK